jgi:uncharacterized protein (TIGR02145 family)
MPFNGSFKNGAYSARTVAGAFCGASMAGTPVVIEHPLPANPSGTPGSRCGAGTVQLSATSSPGAVIDWYDVQAWGSVLFVGNAFTTPSLTATKTFYAEARFTSTGCISSSRHLVTATVQEHTTGSTVDFTAFNPCTGYTPGATASTWTLVDRRESNNVQLYKVRLMHDGRYWMVQDMKFGDKCDKTSFKGSENSNQTRRNLTSISGYPYGDCRNNPEPNTGYLYDWAGAMQKSGAYSGGGSDVSCSGTGAAANACRGICPMGWHIPTGKDSGGFNALHNVASRGCSTDNDDCWDAASAWEGVYGGFCSYDGTLYYQGRAAYYWSSTYYNTSYASHLLFGSNSTYPDTRYSYKHGGFSVRCVRNY